MSDKKLKREERLQRERLRGYSARQTIHAEGVATRKRDNIIWAIAGVVIVGLAVGGQLMYLGAQPKAPEASETSTPTPTATEEVGENQGDVPDKALAENRTWTGTLGLNDVELGITLDGAAAPQAVASTISLASSGFYDGVSCHRLTTSGLFVLQCGDPDGTGSGGPGYSYGPTENAPEDGLYTKGMIAMANSGPYTNGSQFFIVFDDSQLSPDYSVIGEVTSGLDELNKQILSKGTADGSQDGAPKVATTITSFEVK